MLAAIFKMADSRTCVSVWRCVSNQTQIGEPQCGSLPSGQLLFELDVVNLFTINVFRVCFANMFNFLPVSVASWLAIIEH